MTVARRLAAFVSSAAWEGLSSPVKEALKIRVLDSIGCAFGALGAGPMRAVRALVDELGGQPTCTLIAGGRTAPDRATFHNAALVRYLDFNDAYLAAGETCHPSDNLGAVLAAAEARRASGRTLLTALAVAYQVQCRLSEEAPVRERGFDHTAQGGCAAAAGAAKALGLDLDQTAHAVAIAATVSPALRVTRTGALSNWKGLAAPHAGFQAMHCALLAAHQVTGPPAAFEGTHGFMDTLSGPFSIDWAREDLERVRSTSLKRYNAEVHAQSAVEAVIDLVSGADLSAQAIRKIDVDTFDVAFRIIGGGDGSDKTQVKTKEAADHSLPYLIAVAALDRRLMPEQFAAARITQTDVQQLLQRVRVREDPELTARFPEELPCRVRLHLADGRTLEKEKRDYLGFHRRAMSWEDVRAKFDELSGAWIEPRMQERIASAVADLDQIDTPALCALLSPGQPPPPA